MSGVECIQINPRNGVSVPIWELRRRSPPRGLETPFIQRSNDTKCFCSQSTYLALSCLEPRRQTPRRCIVTIVTL
ncbi:hypothetical protein F4775DRAFT_536928 [Biscogniauxia sp. FL1348]|nr:hypothetical protein F4775DRAFT_536928 [Biscogniauxia sp. FL1348]